MKSSVSGPGVYLARNQEYDLPSVRAKELLTARLASPVAETAAGKRERAIEKNLETR